MCKYCEYESDDRPCCEDCYLNRRSHMVFYMNLYRKCEGCVEFYYDRRRQEMLGIQKIVSIKEYNATHKPFCDKCELYELLHAHVLFLKVHVLFLIGHTILSSLIRPTSST